MSTISDWVIMCSGSPWRAAAHRQQALARELARDRRVLFLDPPGHAMRSTLDVERVAERIWHAQPVVVAPGGRVVRRVNRWNRAATAAALRRFLDCVPGRRILWLDEDLAADLVGRCGEDRVVYDATDLDWTFTRRWNRGNLRAALARSVSAADLVLASSPALPAHLPPGRVAPVVVANGCDADRFAAPGPVAESMGELPRPVLGYLGAIDERAFDVRLVRALAERRPGWTFALVGPVQPKTRRVLGGLDNVRLLGPHPFRDAPALVRGMDVGLIPYRVGGVIDYVQPKKLYEYLAAGKPVVSTALPALEPLPGALWVASSIDSFEASVAHALVADRAEDIRRRQDLASSNSWSTKGEAIRRLVDGLVPA
jgi:glycosyltransferase involved in cell wall biosynthesis